MSRRRRLTLLSFAVIAAVTACVAPPAYRGWCSFRKREAAAQCRAAMSRQSWDELESIADRWSAWDPQNGEVWQYRAQAAGFRKDWPTAAKFLWRIPDGDPRAVQAMIEVSKLGFTHLNDPLQGAKACERILQNNPQAAGAQQQLIWFYAMTLQREKLLRQIRSATNAQSEPREAYVYFFLADTLRTNIAVKLNERWLESAPDTELFQVARVLQLPDSEVEPSDTSAAPSVGETPRAPEGRSKLELVDELLNRFPHNVELLAYNAEERIAAGDVDGVATLLSQAPDAAKQDSRFWRIKGWLHESANELEEAAAAYRQALELHSLDWNTMNRLSIVERRRQNVSEVERLTKLVEHAKAIRKDLRQLAAVELVTPSILNELAQLARDCGDREIGPALDRRLAGEKPR